MDKRICTHCEKQKPLSEFHKCKGFKCGVYPKCKECRKIFSKIDYEKRASKIKRYVKRYRKTEAGKLARRREFENRKTKYAKKYKANYTASNAIRDKRLKRLPCEECGAFAEAHHKDYNLPLSITWLCKKHHDEWHRKFKPIY